MIQNGVYIKEKNGNVICFNGKYLYRSSEGYIILFIGRDERMTFGFNDISELFIDGYVIIFDGEREEEY